MINNQSLSSGEEMLYNFLSNHMDDGALIVDQSILSSELNVSERTIRRYLDRLEDKSLIKKIHVLGTVHAYTTRPEFLFSSGNKDFLKLKTNIILSSV
ncbi:DeoR family transcriptional regulator [Aeromonas salmonicida subsp. achromogenes]|uniref:helix-turn-helix domain-containing protein n=1 Tax=Aeromonas salmonicida TaxID=645 RepID=UPI00110FEDEF|nr:DeoR family transcriptional regulator [Aeromonas salmonicida subsp. achromogenes]TMX17891.1 DeoR family transcriptional regulator [Aeromonas salmonicida subsp. achromogenes]TMX18681.1 DeoR family transcriptional regulator [Aeromonas salmonicida subsp. achromogenes]TMX21318.1 DeoR family transcriptional regulator [Aeromonas salmonicida subsp. achromogenes]